MRRKLKVGDLVNKINRWNSEVGTSIRIIIRYHGEGLWEIANVSNMDVTQFHHTLSLRRIEVCK